MDTSVEESEISPLRIAWQLFIGLVVMLENLLLIIVIAITPKLYTTKYIFTASLGITDTIIGLLAVIAVPFNLSFVVTPEGKESFVTTFFIMISSGTVMLSIAQMAIMAVERYIYIVHPFFYERHLTSGAIRWIMGLFWSAGLVSVAVPFILQVFVVKEYISEIGAINVYILKIYLLSGYILMTVITCICYILILCLVRKHRSVVRAWGTEKKVSGWRENAKSLKFFLLVFGFYLLMTSPGFIEECLPEVFDVSDEMKTAFLLAICLNSGINFIILNVVDRKFRQVMKETLSRPVNILFQFFCPSRIVSRSVEVII